MKNIIIIGGGASGITCAIKAKQLNPNFNIIILEKNDRIGKKILKTGNGKCNIGNSNLNGEFYNHPEFIRKIFEKINLIEVIAFFEEMGLLIKKDDSSTRLYPFSETANSVLEIFRYELKRLNVDVKCDHQVLSVKKEREKFIIETNNGLFTSDVLIFASGSIAQEKTNGYQILENFKHSITDLKPGLVPLKTKDSLKSLQGIRVKCKASIFNNQILKHQEEGEILFKDQGLSGILSLNLSRFFTPYTMVSLDLFPYRKNIETELKRFAKKKGNYEALLGVLPKMLALEIIKRSDDNIDKIVKIVRALEFEIIDTFNYDQAQITIGGVKINEINEDFSSRIIKNLFIIGEVLDIDGASGGYNLHFAWVSGLVCAQSLSSI